MSMYYPTNMAFPRRTSDVHFELYASTSPRTHPFPHPPELQQAGLSQQEWQERTIQLYNHFGRWTWSKAEKIVVAVAVALSMIVPILTSILVNHFEFKGLQPLSRDASDQEVADRIQKIETAHAITGGIVLGFYLLVWLPYFAHKAAGTRKLRSLLTTFNTTDANKGTMQSLRWTLVRASTYHRSATICVSLPIGYSAAPSAFTPGAYLPPYLVKEQEASGYMNGAPPAQQQQSQYPPPAGAPPARASYEDEMTKLGMEKDPSRANYVPNRA